MAPSIHIHHQDKYLLFAEKPPRMLTTPAPAGKAENKGKPLLGHLLSEGHHVFAVHRLDYETSGLVLFAKNLKTKDELMGLFKYKAVTKTYEALCLGHMRTPRGVLDFPIRDLGASACIRADGEKAVTRYEVIEEYKDCSLLRLYPETGRHNQIRLHLAHIGKPIVGERKFAIGRTAGLKHKRVLLHATSLKLQPPHLDHHLRIRSKRPPDFEEFLATLGPVKKNKNAKAKQKVRKKK